MDCYKSSETTITIHSISGVYGTICSVGLLVITQKYAYEVLQLQTPIYFIFQLVCMVLLCIIFIKSY